MEKRRQHRRAHEMQSKTEDAFTGRGKLTDENVQHASETNERNARFRRRPWFRIESSVVIYLLCEPTAIAAHCTTGAL